jgi:hypothetical protein
MSKEVAAAACLAAHIPTPYVDYVELDPQSKTHGWLICPDGTSPKCEGRRYRHLPNGPVAWKDRTPRCMYCARHRSRKTEPLVHPKTGSKLDRSDRHPHDKNKFKLICANPSNNPDCLQDTSFMRTERFLHPEFRGVCQNCYSKLPAPRTRLDRVVLDDGPNGSPGTVVDFGGRRDGYVPVTHRCGGEELMKETTLFTYLSDWETGKSKFPARCPDCRLDPDFHRVRKIGQKDGAGTQRRRGAKAKVTPEKLKEAFSALGPFAPQEKVAERIGVEPRSIYNFGKSQGLNYSQLREKFSSTGN